MPALIRAIVVALLYRERGGWFPTGSTQIARLFWAIAVLLLGVWYADAPSWSVALLFISGFVSLLNGHGDHHDLGRGVQGQSTDRTLGELFTLPFRPIMRDMEAWPEREQELFDAAMMAWIGFWRGVIAAAPVAWFDPKFAVLYIVGSSCMGLAYYIGWRIPVGGRGFEPRSTEWGETLTGLFIGLMFLAY